MPVILAGKKIFIWQCRYLIDRHFNFIVHMRKLLAFPFLFFCYYASGQSLEPADGKLAEAYDSAAVSYFANQSRTLAIYNGRVFYGYPGMLGHAFYPDETSWQTGSILYDDTWYHAIRLMYDIHKDEVLILQPNNIPIRLFSERVQKFYYQDMTFVHLVRDKDNVIKSGFYQRLTEGNVTILVKRIKKIDEKIEGYEVERKFIPADQYYVLKDGSYHVIGKQKSLVNLLKDNKQNIPQYLKQQKLKYKTNKEKTIVAIAEFYNQSHK